MPLLDFIFPKKCINCKKFGDFLCADCFAMVSFNDRFQCPICLKQSVGGIIHPYCLRKREIDGIMPVVSYNKVVKKLIYQYKYKPYLSRLSEIISELMAEGLSQNESFYGFLEKYEPTVVPIPLSPKRLRERGYNHAELLASYVAQYFKLKFSSRILVRIKDTKPQYKLNKEARTMNMENAFGISKINSIPNSIILIDDVATTFSTLKEAARVLKSAGAKQVLGVTFAREG